MISRLTLDNYEVCFGALDENVVQLSEAYSRVFVLVDQNTNQYCLPRLRALISDLTVIEISAGEQHKNLETCQLIWKRLFDAEADRQAILINLGGGVIGDMGGFVASTYKRGIDFLQIPTTLLAQVDASVGGKLGIDFYGLKNSVGVFRDPIAVWVDTTFLETLPAREIRSGYAEVVKHALIADSHSWSELRQHLNLDLLGWDQLVPQSVEVKHAIVMEDPFEKSTRKLLNFGHTIGHAIESVFLDAGRSLLHGEAIAIGMICEAYLSVQDEMLEKKALAEITGHLLAIFGKTNLSPDDFPLFLEKMRGDKKNQDGQINFTLLRSIGSGMINQTAKEERILASLAYYTEQ